VRWLLLLWLRLCPPAGSASRRGGACHLDLAAALEPADDFSHALLRLLDFADADRGDGVNFLLDLPRLVGRKVAEDLALQPLAGGAERAS